MEKFRGEKKQKFIKFTIVTTFSMIGIGICLIFYFLIENKTLDLKNFNSLNILLFIPVITIIIFWIRFAWKILKGNKTKKSVRGVDIGKIKEYGVARFMHNELEIKDKRKPEITLKEFHKHFGCDEKNCIQTKIKHNKNEFGAEPAWVVCSQFRDKKTNSLIVPPIEQDYLVYDDNTQQNHLDVDNFDKAQKNWLHNIKTNWKNFNLVNHTLSKLHLLVLGATGSGKTQKLIFPGIIRNSKISYDKKPSMVVTDPKGEIYESTSGMMVKEGYDVKVLNFRDTTSTHSWNPLAITWKYREEAIFYKSRNTLIKTFSKMSSVKEFINKETVLVANNTVKIKCQFHEEIACVSCVELFEKTLQEKGYEDGENIKLYISEGRFHIDEQDFNTKVENKIKSLKSQSEKELLTLGSIIIQSSGQDPFWTDAARGYFIGIASIMLEIMDKNPGALPLEKFNIVNIVKMMDEQDPQKWVNKFREIKTKRGEQSFGYSQISNVINASENTQKSVTLTAKTATTLYSFSSVEALLSDTKNLINLEEIVYGEKPSIIYLIVPDDDKSFHTLAACFVDQLYKSAVKVANLNKLINRTSDATLTRQVQFYLDEFGNFPTIPAMPEMITVARSRNIFFMLILQDYMQLNKAYGADDGKTIKSNCNGNIYIRTNDAETASQLEKEYGEKAILSFGTGENMSAIENKKMTKENKEVTDKLSGSISTVPLIRANEILNIDENFMIVKKTGKNPVIVHSIFSYMVQNFKEYMGMQKAFIPSSSINFMKDHYFSFMSKNYEEWLKTLEDNEEFFLEIEHSLYQDDSIYEELAKQQQIATTDFDFEDLQNAMVLESIQSIKQQKKGSDYQRPQKVEFAIKNEKQQNHELEWKIKQKNKILEMIKKGEEKLESIEEIRDKIEINYSKLSRIKSSLNKYSNLLSSQMSDKEKRLQRELYEEQLKLSQENKLLLSRCQFKID